ncbi:hypothetical protein CY34DRAFT_799296 [Suillus luteus UH-Slu-Lm8-n1]|uniref:Uncharacterized protein n=1 Tax=Suillus luteus UH-Slu-Lm8-n1 TaxID=930992 RepID=A0A0D0ABB1_9AGAM|nr:hypothetical protein CY34DRAFT_799296 [Suillus luteus UH-Slu-Lm8-n1]
MDNRTLSRPKTWLKSAGACSLACIQIVADHKLSEYRDGLASGVRRDDASVEEKMN